MAFAALSIVASKCKKKMIFTSIFVNFYRIGDIHVTVKSAAKE